jgi:spore maturation protein SpmA
VLNHIWAVLVVAGVLFAFGTALHKMQAGETVVKKVDGVEVAEVVRYDTLEKKMLALTEAGSALTKAAFNSVAIEFTDPKTGDKRQGAVGIALGFIGIMALWLGMMKIAEESGLIRLLARAIAPLFRIIFPSVPSDHPAAGAMLMNMAANILGLDNAATPLGIKAMKELQRLNGDKKTASNAMCMFLCPECLEPYAAAGHHYRLPRVSQVAGSDGLHVRHADCHHLRHARGLHPVQDHRAVQRGHATRTAG